MSDDIKIAPTPIQRNCFDVAVELTQLYCKSARIDEKARARIAETFSVFYATAKLCEYSSNLTELLPDNLKNILAGK